MQADEETKTCLACRGSDEDALDSCGLCETCEGRVYDDESERWSDVICRREYLVCSIQHDLSRYSPSIVRAANVEEAASKYRGQRSITSPRHLEVEPLAAPEYYELRWVKVVGDD